MLNQNIYSAFDLMRRSSSDLIPMRHSLFDNTPMRRYQELATITLSATVRACSQKNRGKVL